MRESKLNLQVTFNRRSPLFMFKFKGPESGAFNKKQSEFLGDLCLFMLLKLIFCNHTKRPSQIFISHPFIY